MDLEEYKKIFSLHSAKFTPIKHADTIIAEVYKVTLSEKEPLILKIHTQSADYLREVYFLRQLQDIIPIPKIIATNAPSLSYSGAILMEYIPGELLQQDTWSSELTFEIGSTLAHLHTCRAPSYGDISQPQMLTVDPHAYFIFKFHEELNECRGHLPESLIEKCSSYLNDYQSLFTHLDGPCVVHRDFRAGNLLIFQGKLQGVIDWSSARFGFAEQDFCSLEPSSSFLKGYMSIRPLPDYQPILPLLRLGKALGVIGYTVKSNTWNNKNADLYHVNRKFLNSFDF